MTNVPLVGRGNVSSFAYSDSDEDDDPKVEEERLDRLHRAELRRSERFFVSLVHRAQFPRESSSSASAFLF